MHDMYKYGASGVQPARVGEYASRPDVASRLDQEGFRPVYLGGEVER